MGREALAVPGSANTPAGAPGDSAKAAQAIITAVAATDPPALLLLGADALAAFGGVLDRERAELERWRALSASTGFDS